MRMNDSWIDQYNQEEEQQGTLAKEPDDSTQIVLHQKTPKKPIMLISTEGKPVEQIKHEANVALEKYRQADKKNHQDMPALLSETSKTK